MIKIAVILALTLSFAFGDELPNDAKRLQNLRDQAVKKIDAKFVSQLKQLEKKHMKLGDLKAANAIQDLIANNKVSKVGELNQAATVSKKSIRTAIISLQKNAPVYSNRNYTWGSIPKELDGYFFALGTMRSLKDLDFQVKTSGILYCAFSSYKNLHKDKMKVLIADGWDECSFSIGENFVVLSKHFNKGNASVQWVHPHGGSLLIFKSAE